MPSQMLGRIVVGAAGPVALTVASATANPVAADTTGPSAERSSSTFNGCNYHAYQPFFRSGSNSYLEFWAGFDCPGGGGYSLDIFVQKKGIGSSTWATPNTPQTHLNWRADTPWNYYNYLGQFCSVIDPDQPYYVRTKAVMVRGIADSPGSPAVFSPERLVPASANC